MIRALSVDDHLLTSFGNLPSLAWRACLFLLLCLPAPGADRTISQFVHKAWAGKDGAPANIRAITQTQDGYLWLASSQGLYRFDGVEFERVQIAGQPVSSWSADSLLSTPNGDLWVGSAVSGISLVRNGGSRNFSAADGVLAGTVFTMAQDRMGAIWAATQGGLVRFDGSKWRKIGSESGFEGVPVSLYTDRSGTLWASSVETIFSLPQGATSFLPTALHTGWVTHMAESPDGTIWMAETSRSVRPLPPANGPEIKVGSQKILFDREGGLWITTLGDGLRRAPYPDRLHQEKIERFSDRIESFTPKDGLTADYTLSVFQDHEGNIWVGTAVGLDRFAKGAAVRAPVPGKFILNTMAPGEDGDVWFSCFSEDRGLIHQNKWFSDGPRTVTYSAFRDPNGGTWWAASFLGFREIGRHFTSFDFPSIYRTNRQPVQLALDGSRALWLAGPHGVFVRRDGAWKAVDLPADFPGKDSTVAHSDRDGRVWFGYRENSILLIENSLPRAFSAKDGLRAGVVEAIFASGKFTWITGSQGLQLFDGLRFRDIVPKEGGSFGRVSGVLEPSDGSLWLNAEGGIVRIPAAAVSKLKAGAITAEYSVFDSYDGLPGPTQQSQPFPTLIEATDGKLWFGTSGGPVGIDPKNIPRNELKPPVVIRSLTAKGRQYGSFVNLRLASLTRDIEIDYAALSFVVPERVRYRYKLEGSDKDWHEAGNRRQAFYTNLGPGPYLFRVIASNNDGVWNEAGATLDFSIAPAYYQTRWFEAACVAFFFSFLFGIYRYRLHQMAHQFNVRLEERVTERTRIARELHDTLLQSFQGLMLRLQVVDYLLPEGDAKIQLEETMQRADQAIAEGRTAVYDLRSSTTTTNDLAEAMKALAEELATPGSAAFGLELVGAPRNLHPIIRDEIYRIVREGLRNAFAHAEARHIEVELTYGERALGLRIRDDGKGIPPEVLDQGRSGHYGICGMRERARQIGGKLEVWSRLGAGTEIELSIAGPLAYRTPPSRILFRLFRRKQGQV